MPSKSLNLNTSQLVALEELAQEHGLSESEVARTLIDTARVTRHANPCEFGYIEQGTVQKDGQEIPNCVPVSEALEVVQDE